MKIHRGLASFTPGEYTIVTSGTFDGVHVGHQKILARIREISSKSKGETVLITFWPHPRIVLSDGNTDLKLLSTINEKARLLEKHGIDHLVVLPFTKEFSQLSPDAFIKQVYVQGVGTQKLVIGYDHRFGKNREGGFDYLKEHASSYGFEIEEISRHDIDDVVISSTKIRNALLEGNIEIANQYLGYAYSIEGKVMHGDKIGRTMGFPTANLNIPETFKLIPADGIYAVEAILGDEQLRGMLYIGNRPTLSGATQRRIEVNLFDFDRDIYEESLNLCLVAKIRGDEKLDSLEALKLKLKDDERKSRAIFGM
ncbi:bifunctional riboflavin kinase/FAD synthetase [Microscilla marina]|uniref:Riboflavin biosynthesis protein n=1 Tax=Microscilla marina ATCC 23134 TaxID=313606 RepID=A1ZFF9_MICM2|nr:bifunctional riboflavin kinase/FAD synthetase [Microscilla marina]EAY30733.1 riboflavin biosynthesis protein RibF [Microscilla marina ATCC 23134]